MAPHGRGWWLGFTSTDAGSAQATPSTDQTASGNPNLRFTSSAGVAMRALVIGLALAANRLRKA